MSWFRNFYRHKDCKEQPGIEWDDEWDCTCNDRCPACNAEIEPYESDELSEEESDDEELPDFLDNYEVEPNHIVGPENTSWDGGMFETYGEEEAHVIKTFETRPKHVWTILDCDGKLRVINGLHYVNRFAYLISKQPCLPEHADLTFR